MIRRTSKVNFPREGRKRERWFNENTGEYSMTESSFKHSEVLSQADALTFSTIHSI